MRTLRETAVNVPVSSCPQSISTVLESTGAGRLLSVLNSQLGVTASRTAKPGRMSTDVVRSCLFTVDKEEVRTTGPSPFPSVKWVQVDASVQLCSQLQSNGPPGDPGLGVKGGVAPWSLNWAEETP